MFILKLIKAALVILVFLAAFLPVYVNISAFAAEAKYPLDELRYIKLQIDEIFDNVYLAVGWFYEERESVLDASKRSVKDLKKIRIYLSRLTVQGNLEELKDSGIRLIDKMIESYNGIEDKNTEKIKATFKTISEYDLIFQKNLEKAIEAAYRNTWDNVPDNYDPVDEDIRLMKTDLDRHRYTNAVKLLKWDKDCKQAYEIFESLKEEYKGTPLEDYINMRISDCFFIAYRGLDDFVGIDTVEEGIKILSDLSSKKTYSPLFFESFYKWRTMDQQYNHGSSNTSEILNREYNAKRWQIVKIIRSYLEDNPEDLWAHEQINLLLTLENIRIGGRLGNSNNVHWAWLYTEIFSKSSAPKKEERDEADSGESKDFRKLLEALETTETSRLLKDSSNMF